MQCRNDSGHGQDAAWLGRRVADGPGLARAFEQAGVAAVIVHGRTRQQGFKGTVSRAGIRAVVEAVDRIPVVANGDIRTIADAAATFEETGCAAISIGRGALANPFLFRQLDCWGRTGDPGPDPTFEERIELMCRHFRGLVERRGERHGCLQFRKILKWYFHFTRLTETVLPSLAQPLEPGAFRGSDRARPDRRPGFAPARDTTTCTCRCHRGRLISGRDELWHVVEFISAALSISGMRDQLCARRSIYQRGRDRPRRSTPSASPWSVGKTWVMITAARSCRGSIQKLVEK